MQIIAPNDMNSWKISYNPYIDLFQMFNSAVFHTPDSNLKKSHRGDITVLYLKNGNRPMLVEFKNAYSHLGDVDNMSKTDIIRTIVGTINAK